MSFETSMIYTLGSALSRAQDEQLRVDVLVEGMWLSGTVVIHDGVGVVLDLGEEHSIVKVTAISAVRVSGKVPGQRLPHGFDATPMPGPRSSDAPYV